MRETFVVVEWPESQLLFDKEGFRENAYLVNDEVGMETFGSAAYFVNKKWYEANS